MIFFIIIRAISNITLPMTRITQPIIRIICIGEENLMPKTAIAIQKRKSNSNPLMSIGKIISSTKRSIFIRLRLFLVVYIKYFFYFSYNIYFSYRVNVIKKMIDKCFLLVSLQSFNFLIFYIQFSHLILNLPPLSIQF